MGRLATRVLSAGGTDTTTDTYAYLGSGETVVGISSSVATTPTPTVSTTKSLLDLEGSRLATRAGAAAATFTLFDQLGSLIGLVDGTRTITGATRFDGYGEQVAATGASSPWRFRGNLDISPSGDALYDMGARFYAPSMGAFTQMDTVAGSAANPASMNRFLYAEGNPATLIDPSGHMARDGQVCDTRYDDCVGTRTDGSATGATRGGQPGGPTGGCGATHTCPRDSESITPTAPAAPLEIAGVPVNADGLPLTQEGAATLGAICSSASGMYKDVDACNAWRAYLEYGGGTADPHLLLDGLGLLPGLGEIFDGINAVWYATEGDLLNAGASGLAAVPFVGWLATGGKGVKRATDAATAVKLADGAADMVKYSDDAVGPLTGTTRAASACLHSFAGATPVLTRTGPVPIAQLERGDEVIATDPETGETGDYEVTATWAHTDPVSITVVIDGEAIVTTPTHPFMTPQGWTEAQDLVPGGQVLRHEGGSGTVESLTWDATPAERYDLTVETAHTFFVGQGEWWVHNSGCEEWARDFVKANGGEKKTFRPPAGVKFLGPYLGATEAWGYHTVVVRDGRVFDQWTELNGLTNGMPIDEWKSLWDYSAEIEFGF